MGSPKSRSALQRLGHDVRGARLRRGIAVADLRALAREGALGGPALINAGRGGLQVEADILRALEDETLTGASLDVFEVEPLPTDSPLLALDNVLLCGHLAGLDEEPHRDTFAMTADVIVGLHGGKWPGECIQNLRGKGGWCW